MKIDIVIAPRLYQPVTQRLEGEFAIHPLWEAKEPLAFLASVADRVRGFASFTGYPVPAKLMAALPKLEIIASMSVGTDHIDLAAAKARGIAVTNAPDVLTDCVADLGMGLTINLARDLVAADRFVRAGDWAKGLFRSRPSSAARRWGSSASAVSARRWQGVPRRSACASSITAGDASPTLPIPSTTISPSWRATVTISC